MDWFRINFISELHSELQKGFTAIFQNFLYFFKLKSLIPKYFLYIGYVCKLGITNGLIVIYYGAYRNIINQIKVKINNLLLYNGSGIHFKNKSVSFREYQITKKKNMSRKRCMQYNCWAIKTKTKTSQVAGWSRIYLLLIDGLEAQRTACLKV
jgi:hypothetical protein